MLGPKQFLRALATTNAGAQERLVALLWFLSLNEPDYSAAPAALCEMIESAGFGKQNVSRSRKYLESDRRTIKAGKDQFRISEKSRHILTEAYATFVDVVPAERTDSVLVEDLFSESRGYTQKVVRQLNASYYNGLFDCTAVMCRRLLETLIIEAYERADAAESIKGADGQFLMFSGLLAHIENNGIFSLGRNALTGLKDFKRLGDLSAHNRRFNARKQDIDAIRSGLRVACEELLHLAGQAS